MPASYRIYPVELLKYVHVTETIELAELLELTEQYFRDPMYDVGHRMLVDLRDLRQSSAGFREAIALYGRYRQVARAENPPTLVAIVAPTDFSFGMSKMFFSVASMGNVMRIRIFETMPEAGTWLSLTADTLARLRAPNDACMKSECL